MTVVGGNSRAIAAACHVARAGYGKGGGDAQGGMQDKDNPAEKKVGWEVVGRVATSIAGVDGNHSDVGHLGVWTGEDVVRDLRDGKLYKLYQ